jgi:hypothetical protein
MWRRVDLVWADVSEERNASIFRVEKSASEEPAWAGACTLRPPTHAGSSLANFSTLKMEVIPASEASVYTRSTWRHIPEDGILHRHRRENLKSYIITVNDEVHHQTWFWANAILRAHFSEFNLKYYPLSSSVFRAATEQISYRSHKLATNPAHPEPPPPVPWFHIRCHTSWSVHINKFLVL